MAFYLWIMNIIRLLCELFVIYLLFKLVFDFIIPVYRTTKQMKQKVQDMHSRMEQQRGPSYETQVPPVKPAEKPKDIAKEYIDFEEVK